MKRFFREVLYFAIWFIFMTPFVFVFALVAWSLNGSNWVLVPICIFVALALTSAKILHDRFER